VRCLNRGKTAEKLRLTGVLVISVLKVTLSRPLIQLDNTAPVVRNSLICIDSPLFAAEP